MPKTIVYLQKSNRPGKKYMVYIEGKTIHFGADGMSDYTIHKDKERMKRYSARHSRGGENWKKSGIKTAGFWSKWLLWNKPTLSGSKKDISTRFNVTFKNRLPTKKNISNPRKSARKSRKSPRKSARKSSSKSARKSRKSPRKSARKSPRKSARKSPRKSARKSGRKVGKKYERCVLAVKSKQPIRCFENDKWIGGKGCVNPFAVCTAKVGRYN